jgi:hypothetical protein
MPAETWLSAMRPRSHKKRNAIQPRVSTGLPPEFQDFRKRFCALHESRTGFVYFESFVVPLVVR